MSRFPEVAAPTYMTLLRLLSAAAFVAIPASALVGCGAKVATVLASNDGGDPSNPDGPERDGGIGDGATASDCVSKGGVCLPSGSSAPPSRRIASPGEGRCAGTDACWVTIAPPAAGVCHSDPECNEDSVMSGLAGECFYGICVCKLGYHVQPSGRCNATRPPDCTALGGTCFSPSGTCPDGKLQGAGETNRSCGDLVEAVCCIDTSSCRGPAIEEPDGGRTPVDFRCCAPNDAVHEPICVHGHQTCPPDDAPVAKPGLCG